MPEYLAPGVYVEEVEIGGKPIEGVSTSTAGFLGETERGPLTPRLVTSFNQFHTLFGGHVWSKASGAASNSYLPYAVEGYFANGGKRCFVGRVLARGSKEAFLEVQAAGPENPEAKREEGAAAKTAKKARKRSRSPAQAFKVRALAPGAWGNRVGFRIAPASLSSLNPALFKLVVVYWSDAPPKPVVDPTDAAKIRDPKRREPSILEDYDNLSVDPASADSRR